MDTFHIRVAGSSYRQEAVLATRSGDHCILVPEPTNPHDPNAIQIINDEIDEGMLGFVPREQNVTLLEAIKAGCTITATVEGTGKPDNSEFHGVSVRLEVEYPA